MQECEEVAIACLCIGNAVAVARLRRKRRRLKNRMGETVAGKPRKRGCFSWADNERHPLNC